MCAYLYLYLADHDKAQTPKHFSSSFRGQRPQPCERGHMRLASAERVKAKYNKKKEEKREKGNKKRKEEREMQFAGTVPVPACRFSSISYCVQLSSDFLSGNANMIVFCI
jgi:hypothetical protein